jgi:uncharacterized membrane protein YfcA
MSKEQLTNMAWDIITQIFAKANLLFITIGGSFIVLLNAYHIKKQSFWDAVFESAIGFILGYSIGWIVLKFTNNPSMMLSAALISCLASKSLVSYVMTKTSTHIDTLAKSIVKKIKP